MSIDWPAAWAALAQMDGDEWDAESERLDYQWRAEYERAFLAVAVSRPGWAIEDAREWASDCVSDALATYSGSKTPAVAEAGRLREALAFYADPANWRDTPSWDGDPDCITPKAIPVDHTQEGSPCDCGDRARAALEGGAK